jgi:hypothetical protein
VSSSLVVRPTGLDGDPTDAVARHELAHAITACVLGWQVGKVSVTRDGSTLTGSCEISPPPGRSSFQCTLDQLTILLAGRAGCIAGDDRADTDLAVELASGIVGGEEEGQALIDYAQARAIAIVERAIDSGVFDRFVDSLNDSGGVIDLQHRATRDFAPLFEIRAAPITVNVPPPIINITSAPVTVENQIDVQQPDKLITFHRNGDGELIEAETTTAPVAA